MKRALFGLAVVLVVAASAGAYLVSNSRVGSRFVFERVPTSRRPLDIRVDSDPIVGIANTVGVTQQLMNQWNAVPGTADLFGIASAGGSFNGLNARRDYGVFTNRTHEVAFDDDGSVLAAYGLSSGVLGITLKVVDASDGDLLDFLIIVNTRNAALTAPAGSGATRLELFQGTLLHELGHAIGLGHSAVGMANVNTHGLALATPAQIPTMYPFRLPGRPQEGGTLEADDIAAMRVRYTQASIGRGSISGRVQTASGTSVNEIAVRAVGPGDSNQSHIGVLTNVDASNQGLYRIDNLPPGGYRVLIETIDGRGSVDGGALAGSSTTALGANPFLLAQDEFWQIGESWDATADAPTAASIVQVRPDRDTGGVDFLLNATPIFNGNAIVGTLGDGDARIPDAQGDRHFGDFFVFRGSAGESIDFRVATDGFTPQITLHRPSGLVLEALDEPTFGTRAALTHTLQRSGIYTVLVRAADPTNFSFGRGSYQVSLSGSGGTLPAVPTPTGASLTRGPATPLDPAVGSPTCEFGVLQIRATAGSHEELWIDELVVHGDGTGNELTDVSSVLLVRDTDGDGRVDPGERVVGETTFDEDDGRARFTGLGIEVDAGTTADFVVAYTVDAPPLVVPAGLGVAVLGAVLLSRRRRFLLAMLLLPLACGGGGSGGPEPACFTPFDATQPTVTFQAEIRRGDVIAFSSAGSATTPLPLPDTTVASDVLTVSRRP